MRVSVLSKRQFDSLMIYWGINDDNVSSRDEEFFISITDTDKFSKSREPYFKNDHINVLNLAFDDCLIDGEPSPSQPKGTTSFTEKQSKILLAYILKHLDKKHCIIHCMAGISRSGAVGTFIDSIVNEDDFKFKKENTQIYPNPKVLRLLNDRLNENK